MAMRLGKAILHTTKKVAVGGGSSDDKDKESESASETPCAPSTGDVKLRRGAEDLLTQQQLQELEGSENYYESYIESLNKYANAHKVLQDSDRQIAHILKARGDEFKKIRQSRMLSELMEESEQEYKFGAFLHKVAQVSHVLCSMGNRHCDIVIKNTNLPMNQFHVDYSKAKEQLYTLDKLRDNYMSASAKVRSMKQTSKQDLSKIQRVETERNAIGKNYDKMSEDMVMDLERIVTRAKLDSVDQACQLIEERVQYHQKALDALMKAGEEVRSFRGQLQEHAKTTMERQLTRAANNRTERPKSIATKKAHFGDKRDMQEIVVDVAERNITLAGRLFSIEEVLQVVRIKNKNLRLILEDESDEKIAFHSRVEREKFIESFWLLKEGLDRPLLTDGNLAFSQELKICCATWNMGDAPPKWNSDPIDTWLPHGYDVYAIAAQECSYSPRHGYNSCEDDFYGWIGNHLGDGFLKLASTSLMNIRLGIFIRRHLYYKVSNLRYTTVATGLANIIGNKGAAAVAFSIYDTSFCFLGSHLAARIDKNRLGVRNQNYRDIISRLPFSQFADTHHEFDHFFWLGDLNYRIELPRDDIMSKVKARDWYSLRQHDQLVNEKNVSLIQIISPPFPPHLPPRYLVIPSGATMENCFVDFDEGDIDFGPTYRFDRGTREWSEQKMREPAWCDRVLWKSVYAKNVKVLAYAPAHGLMTSDHSPLYAGLSLQLEYPPIPHARANCKIKFTQLKGMNIIAGKEGKESDLYVTFQAPWLSSSHSTTSDVSVEKAPNPVWHDSDIPELTPIITSRETLSRQWLRIIVRDKCDMSKSSVVGSGVVRLDEACEKSSPFVCNISDRGLPLGALKGVVHVTWSNEAPSYRGTIDESVLDGLSFATRRSSASDSPRSSSVVPSGNTALSVSASANPTSPVSPKHAFLTRAASSTALVPSGEQISRKRGLNRATSIDGRDGSNNTISAPSIAQSGWRTVRKKSNPSVPPLSNFDHLRASNSSSTSATSTPTSPLVGKSPRVGRTPQRFFMGGARGSGEDEGGLNFVKTSPRPDVGGDVWRQELEQLSAVLSSNKQRHAMVIDPESLGLASEEDSDDELDEETAALLEPDEPALDFARGEGRSIMSQLDELLGDMGEADYEEARSLMESPLETIEEHHGTPTDHDDLADLVPPPLLAPPPPPDEELPSKGVPLIQANDDNGELYYGDGGDLMDELLNELETEAPSLPSSPRTIPTQPLIGTRAGTWRAIRPSRTNEPGGLEPSRAAPSSTRNSAVHERGHQ